jgi:hypothetical protein
MSSATREEEVGPNDCYRRQIVCCPGLCQPGLLGDLEWLPPCLRKFPQSSHCPQLKMSNEDKFDRRKFRAGFTNCSPNRHTCWWLLGFLNTEFYAFRQELHFLICTVLLSLGSWRPLSTWLLVLMQPMALILQIRMKLLYLQLNLISSSLYANMYF